MEQTDTHQFNKCLERAQAIRSLVPDTFSQGKPSRANWVSLPHISGAPIETYLVFRIRLEDDTVHDFEYSTVPECLRP